MSSAEVQQQVLFTHLLPAPRHPLASQHPAIPHLSFPQSLIPAPRFHHPSCTHRLPALHSPSPQAPASLTSAPSTLRVILAFPSLTSAPDIALGKCVDLHAAYTRCKPHHITPPRQHTTPSHITQPTAYRRQPHHTTETAHHHNQHASPQSQINKEHKHARPEASQQPSTTALAPHPTLSFHLLPPPPSIARPHLPSPPPPLSSESSSSDLCFRSCVFFPARPSE